MEEGRGRIEEGRRRREKEASDHLKVSLCTFRERREEPRHSFPSSSFPFLSTLSLTPTSVDLIQPEKYLLLSQWPLTHHSSWSQLDMNKMSTNIYWIISQSLFQYFYVHRKLWKFMVPRIKINIFCYYLYLVIFKLRIWRKENEFQEWQGMYLFFEGQDSITGCHLWSIGIRHIVWLSKNEYLIRPWIQRGFEVDSQWNSYGIDLSVLWWLKLHSWSKEVESWIEGFPPTSEVSRDVSYQRPALVISGFWNIQTCHSSAHPLPIIYIAYI